MLIYKLLTTPNPEVDADKELFQTLNLRPRPSFKAGEPAFHLQQIPDTGILMS